MIRNQKGFSLVELMVVVAIIGVLSAIAIPQINKYMARARQTEAKTNLSAIYTSNKAFYAEYNIYDSRFEVIGYLPEGRLRYNTGWTDGTGQCTLANYGYTGNTTGVTNAVARCTVGSVPGANGCIVLADGNQALPTAPTPTSLNCTQSFVAGASGKVSTGATIDQWTIDNVKTLNNGQDGTR